MHSVITIATDNVLYEGIALLNSWTKSSANELCIYDFNCSQDKKEYIISFSTKSINITYADFMQKMMFYKMVLIRDFLVNNKHIDRITYLDLDTMVVKNWDHIWEMDFDFAMTIRPGIRPCLNANAGVLFFKNNTNSINFLNWCINCMQSAASYNHNKDGRIRKVFVSDTLFDFYIGCMQRNGIKCLRSLFWWCDQTFLSAICEECYKTMHKRIYETTAKVFGYKVGLLPCPIYNDTSAFTFSNLNDEDYLKNRFIIHFKGKRKKRVYPFVADNIYNASKRPKKDMDFRLISEYIKKDPKHFFDHLTKGLNEANKSPSEIIDSLAMFKSRYI